MKKLFATACALVLSLAISAQAAPEFTFTLACHVSDESVLSKGFYGFAKDVEQKSGGRIKINVSTAAVLGGQREIIENVNMGAIEMGLGESGLYANYVPAFGVMVLPFMHASKDAFYAAVDGKPGQHLEELLEAETNMKLLSWLDGGGPRDVYSVTPLASIDALRSVKIRTPESPVFVATFKAFQANPTTIAAPEMYTALQQKVVTAMEGTYETAVTYGVIGVAKYCLETRHIYNESSLVINKDVFKELPADLQKVLIECAAKLEQDERALNEVLMQQFKQKMIDESVTFTPVDMNKAREMAAGVYKQYIDGNAAKQKVYDLLTAK